MMQEFGATQTSSRSHYVAGLTLKKIIEYRMEEFQLSWDNIIAVTTDGAYVMLKLGRLLPCDHNI